ncbi:efflux transporter outer membrane subunit [Novosphingobium album (ex Liu et al. 2023)]|uniref:Efflux transporter outer membrane subunit n=1 Tax=Novosphingobium album (ex Liu et al. 2023) TaxID=3031130 RepID=A0ABT5WSV2_9SPHN|nr:efflux transporter outer membrane subunit [Novosphingobium album (ex Liu et al. 2023)]MDE8653119.1 efflux transporter outer membrane subunit [Novosphingobium album (ex Liu et al. 2023)]
MRSSPRFLMLGAALALAGCNMAPRYVRPGLPVPPETPRGEAYGPGDPAAAPVDLAATAWTEFFAEPRLREVIGLALANNRDLRLALARVEQARAQYRVQRADIFPTLGADAGATFQKSPLGAGSAGGAQGAVTGRADIYSASLGVSAWEVDLFGRLRNLTEAAQEQFLAADENRKAAQVALVAEVATAWLTLAADHDRLTIAGMTVQAYGETVALNEARFKAGVASELDVRQARTGLDQARADKAALTTQVAQDRNALELLAGTPIEDRLLPDTLPARGVTIERLPGDLPSEILLRRPDIAAAEHQLIAANANIGAARAAFFPRISLTVALGTISLGLSNLFQNGSETWSVAPSANLPIFDFGRNAGNLAYARATREAMLAQYEKTVQTAFREVADALARRGTIDEQLAAQVSLEDNARTAFRLSDARFRAGVEPYLTTLDAQRTYYAAQQSLVGTLLVRAGNAVELYRATGGGLAP